ncbi:MAG TPA: GNAT family N-acetyltransferase [Polyangiaceae bacterium]|nr:GNAT family N-acetyltransferase [Polyangiaceae bacterium]
MKRFDEARATDAETYGAKNAAVSDVYRTDVIGLGRFSLLPLRLPDDIPTIHAWVNDERARFWGMEGKTTDQVACAYAEILLHADVFLGFHEDRAAFLLERYSPLHDAIGKHYAVLPGDLGMHVLVAPSEQRISGFTRGVFAVVTEFLFCDPTVGRIVVEPDIRNRKIHALNHWVGFRYDKVVELPNKTAHLAFCTRAQHAAALRRESAAESNGVGEVEYAAVGHPDRETWTRVNAALVRKAIAELAHERLLIPEREAGSGPWAFFTLVADDAALKYQFRARVLSLNHWDIHPSSIVKTRRGDREELDAAEFILEFNQRLGIDASMLSTYLEEISSTLYAAAYKRARQEWTAADLVHAGFQEIECAMSEGHPAFVANGGRVGFDAADYSVYAPEAGAPLRLVWLAAHRNHAEFNAVDGLSYDRLLREELGQDEVQAFETELRDQGVEPQDYVLMPVHPWQWFNKLALTFAPDIAARDLICLGWGADTYRAQQSIRTFFNVSHPRKRYVKTALSVLNMGFMRGLSAEYMRVTPAINQWIDELLKADPYIEAKRFGILREVAAVGYRQRHFEAALPKGNPYRKMLAALWRESPVPHLKAGEQLMTMAALLHRDREGRALLPQLIAASGVGTDLWLDGYLDSYLSPLVHCFYRYDLAFMPHGENVILVLENDVPVRAFLKDIAEEAVVMNAAAIVPARAERLCVDIPGSIQSLCIFTDVFDGIFRFVAQILDEQGGYPEENFWRRVAACLLSYQREHPELRERFERHDLFVPEFLHSCLNRLQLANNEQMIDLTDPAKNLQFAGTLPNPVAPFREMPSSPVQGRDSRK